MTTARWAEGWRAGIEAAAARVYDAPELARIASRRVNALYERIRALSLPSAPTQAPEATAPTKCKARRTSYEDDEPGDSWICNAPLVEWRRPIHGFETTEEKQGMPRTP